MTDRITARNLQRADPTVGAFLPNRLPRPLDGSEHCYTEARFADPADAYVAVTQAGFFNGFADSMREGDHIVIQLGAHAATAWHFRVAVDVISEKAADLVTVAPISPIWKPADAAAVKEKRRA